MKLKQQKHEADCWSVNDLDLGLNQAEDVFIAQRQLHSADSGWSA